MTVGMPSESPPSNDVALSVSDLAASLKRTVETNYDHVVVRGELGRVTIARSGHMYCDLKDERAVLNTVMWKGQVSRLPFKPEEGLEVIATGRLSIYEGRSNYQMIAASMRPAGAGALMALLEERKKKFDAEGLFAPEHKKPLPYLPRTIGVVTSPTGAVIRDILHRIGDRFPVRVIVWPALVQGDNAAGQITAGIQGFNAMTGADRPDVLIVARGGGSIEDLWPFNEESVARALAACGGNDSKGVAVTEAPDVAARADLRPSGLDTTYADSGLFADPRLHPDSLRADSLRRDSLRADSLAQAARPDFRAFFPRFRAAAEAGTAAGLATDGVDRDLLAAALAPPFRAGVLALTARDFAREGTARTAVVVVGYDTEGRVVPQDEADTESAVVLRFDVVDGAYRLVAVDLAG